MKRVLVFNLFFTLMFAAYVLPSPCPAAVTGDSTVELVAKALQLRENNREEEALALFEKVLQTDPTNYPALLNGAYLHFRQGWLYSEKDKRKEHFLILQTYAGRALELRPMEYQARLIAVVAKAKTTGYLTPGEQVQAARQLQEDLENLLAMVEDDPNSIYVLSWLNFKVGKTSSLEKLLARVLFGGLPENLTTDKAFALMEKAMTLRPDYAVYTYDMGLFHQRLGELSKAQPWFTKVLSMEAKTAEEVVYKKWAGQRLLEIDGQKVANR